MTQSGCLLLCRGGQPCCFSSRCQAGQHQHQYWPRLSLKSFLFLVLLFALLVYALTCTTNWQTAQRQLTTRRGDDSAAPELPRDAAVVVNRGALEQKSSFSSSSSLSVLTAAPRDGVAVGSQGQQSASASRVDAPPVLSQRQSPVQTQDLTPKVDVSPVLSQGQSLVLTKGQSPVLATQEHPPVLPQGQLSVMSRGQPPILTRDQPQLPVWTQDQPQLPVLTQGQPQPPVLSQGQTQSMDNSPVLTQDQPASLPRVNVPDLSQGQPSSQSGEGGPPTLAQEHQRQRSSMSAPSGGCDVLESMVRGRWEPRPYAPREMDALAVFIRNSRDQHNLPPTLQRPDGKCGNVTFSQLYGKMHKLLWFRALCDPAGSHPCCLHNRCTANVTVQECRCPDCYDMRQPIHAEFATWVPSEPACQINYFHNKTDTCGLLKNTTVVMIGDSFMRHVHTAVLSLLRSDLPFGPRHKNTSHVRLQMCRDDFIYQQACADTLDRDTRECSNTTNMKFFEYIAADKTPVILSTISRLRGIPNSYVLLGLGIHNDFNFEAIAPVLLQPLLNVTQTSRWPEVIWMSTHAPGLLKTPRVPSQSAESILAYNQKVKAVLQTNAAHVPILDFYELTKDAMSFDGAHYGRGVNSVKAQIFLNYIQDRQRKMNPIESR